MTVSSQQSTVTYQGDGATTNWVFSFSAPDASVIDVYVTNDQGIVRKLTPAEFQVVLNFPSGTNPTPTGGIVIYSVGGVPIPVGFSITIDRNVPAVQNTSLTNQSIIYPPVVERALDYLTMLNQKGGLDLDRAIKVPIGDPPPADLPPKDARVNQQAFFDANGNLTAGLPPAGGAVISAAMQPVVAAATIDQARALMGLEPDPKVITDGYVLVADDSGRTLSLEGSKYYLVTAADSTTYPTNFVVQLVNHDTRAKLANIFGYPGQFVIYPDQQVFVNRTPSGWVITRPGRWRPLVAKQLFVDPILGSDDPAVADGLASGSGAFKTIAHAAAVQESSMDGDFTINLANGTYSGGIVLNKRAPGGTAYKLVGNVGNASSVNIVAATGTNGIVVSDGVNLEISGITFSGAAGTASIWIIKGGIVSIVGNVVFGSNQNSYNIVMFDATLYVNANYSIAAGATMFAHIGAFYNGTVMFSTLNGPIITVTLQGTISCTGAYYYCELNATMVAVSGPPVYAGGGAIGFKAVVAYNAIVNMGGDNVPGDQPAQTSNGGYFF
jgi:hypothetical protein